MRPFLVSISLTSRCPLSCPHCFAEASPKGTDMPPDTVKRVLYQIKRLSPFSMVILTGGEPLLREDLEEIVSWIAEAGLFPVLATTGIGFSEERGKRLKDAGLSGLSVSLDSASSGFHDRFRGVKGSWERAVETLKVSRSIGLETQINATITDENAEEIEDIVDLGAKLGVRAVNFFFIVCTGRAMRTSVSTRVYPKVLERISRIALSEKRVIVRARCAPHIYRFFPEKGLPVGGGTRGCPAGRYYLRIDELGRVYPCPYMPLPVGDLKKENLEEVWERSEVLRTLRTENYSGRCGICRFRVLCGGCRARALTEVGDLMGEDPLCDYRPEGVEEPVRPETGEGRSFKLRWTEEAKRRIEKVPLFLRSVVVRIVERVAEEEGVSEITPEFLERVRRLKGG